MGVAGELDDRWPGSRKWAGREESPDTETAKAVWATRLVTPGELLQRLFASADGRRDGSRTVPQRIYRRRCDTR
jgi:hypothetical protein